MLVWLQRVEISGCWRHCKVCVRVSSGVNEARQDAHKSFVAKDTVNQNAPVFLQKRRKGN